ncbi:MAG: hypothetical protein ABL931_08695 [Usitatibacteraceae bacterium]
MQTAGTHFPKLFFALLIALFSTVSSGLGPPTIQIIPASPRYQEPVVVRFKPSISECIFGSQVTMVGTTITVKYSYQPELCGGDYDIELGRFPAGTYTVTVEAPVPISTQFTVSPLPPRASSFPGNRPMANYSGLWWSPSESGWGLSITQGATNELFAVWFAYDPSGEPVWYTMQPGKWTSYYDYTGPIYKTTGPYFGGPFNPALVTETQVGTGGLSFRHSTGGILGYVINGVQGRKTIERMVIE